MGELGLFGLVVPEEYGGCGRATSPRCAWPSRSSAGSTSRSASRSSAGVGLGINPILTFGTEEQKQRWLPDLVAGRALAALRADRARGGLGRRRHPDPRRAATAASG